MLKSISVLIFLVAIPILISSQEVAIADHEPPLFMDNYGVPVDSYSPETVPDMHKDHGTINIDDMSPADVLRNLRKNNKIHYSDLMRILSGKDKTPPPELTPVFDKQTDNGQVIPPAAPEVHYADPDLYIDNFLKFLHKRVGEILWGANNDPDSKSSISKFLKLILQTEDPQDVLGTFIENGRMVGIFLTLLKDVSEFNREFTEKNGPVSFFS